MTTTTLEKPETKTLDTPELTTRETAQPALARGFDIEEAMTADGVPVIPNVSFLGRGYDIVTLDPVHLGAAPGRKDQEIFRFTPSDTQLTPDGRWRYPKGTNYAPDSGGAISSKESSLYCSSDYQHRFSETVKASLGFAGVAGFSASASYNSFREVTTTQKSISTYTEYEVSDFALDLASDGTRYSPELHLDDRFGGFAPMVEALPAQASPKYREFIAKFGTHFSDRAAFGGRARQAIEIYLSTYAELTREGVDVGVEAKATFDGATGSAGSSTSTDNYKKFEQASGKKVSEISFSGGTPNHDLDVWSASVKNEPDAVKLRLVPIFELFSGIYFPGDPDIAVKQGLMKKAIEAYVRERSHVSAAAIRYGVTFDKVWNDKDSKSDRDITAYYPTQIPQGYLPVGQYAQDNYHSPKGQLLLVKEAHEIEGVEPAVAHPESFEFLWKDKGLGGDVKNASFWRMVPPAGYVALGDVLVRHWSTPPNTADYYCVRQDLCEKGVAGEKIWSDQGEADKTVSVWPILPASGSNALAAGTFYVLPGSRSHPDNPDVWVLEASAI